MTCLAYVRIPGNDPHIPRKYLRNLNGKPLLHYTLEMLKTVLEPQHIVVVTDDEEVEMQAKRLQCHCLMIASGTPLPIGFDAQLAQHLIAHEKEKNVVFDTILWMEPAYPLLRARDIQKAKEKLVQEQIDALFSVSTMPLANWQYQDTYQPFFIASKNNRDNVLHKELGAFFMMKRQSITLNGYQGKKASPYSLQENHALEINSMHELWVAEKILKKKQVLFVVAGYPEIGMGHVYRALTLAQEFGDHEVQFLCTKESHAIVPHIATYQYPVFLQQENKSLLNEIIEISPDIVINDILNTDDAYVESLQALNMKVINFEDQGSGAKKADLVINALYNQAIEQNILAGHHYVDVRDEFVRLAPVHCQQEVTTLTITFGGMDKHNLTLRLLKLVLQLSIQKLMIQVITGPGYSHHDEMDAYLATLSFEIRDKVNWIRNGTKKMSEYMSLSDIGITSAGRTVYEFAILAIPTIVIATNERETTHYFAEEVGMRYLGQHDCVSDHTILQALNDLLYYENRQVINAKLQVVGEEIKNAKNNIIVAIKPYLDELKLKD